MKIGSFLQPLLLIFILIMEVSVTMRGLQREKTQLDSLKLAQAIDNSAKYAFSNALKISDLEQTYDGLDTYSVDPTNVLNDFAFMFTKCYGKAMTEESYNAVKSYIDGAILCDHNGYYILRVQETPYGGTEAPESYTVQMYDNEERVRDGTDTSNLRPSTETLEKTGSVAYGLYWGAKLPYYYEVGNEHLALDITNADTTIIKGYIDGALKLKRNTGQTKRDTKTETYMVGEEQVTISYVEESGVYLNYSGEPYKEEELNDSIKVRVINTLLAKQLNSSIDEITKVRGRKRQYTVYFPTTGTVNGINPVKNTGLIMSMSQSPFSQAKLTKPVLAGYTAVEKEYVVGFYNTEDKVYQYCYASQLPSEISEAQADKLEMFTDFKDAARAGYSPSLKYITRPVVRKKQVDTFK